jgi:transposase-like protein
MSKTTRAQWAKRVERWLESGLTAKEFAAELNVSPSVLARWRRALERSNGVDAERAHGAMRSAGAGPMVGTRSAR